jgi:hypothetical protein
MPQPNSNAVRVRQRPQTSTALQTERPSTFTQIPIDQLEPAKRRVRKHPRGKLDKLVSTIRRFGVVAPILVDKDNHIIDGHLLWEALKTLGHTMVHVQRADHLSEAEIETFRIAHHALLEMGQWDVEQLKISVEGMIQIDPELVAHTLLPMGKIDGLLLSGFDQPADEDSLTAEKTSLLQHGDAFIFGPADGALTHRLVCGDAKDPTIIAQAVSGKPVRMLFSDVPYGLVPIEGVVSAKHKDFVEGASMSEPEAISFFTELLGASVPHVVQNGAVFLFIDHRGMYGLTEATRSLGLSHICTVAWDKTAGGMGGLYRHQVEFVLVLAKGERIAVNNVQLGRHGRNRTTLWSSSGMAQFGADRKAALEAHPTVKPVQLLSEAILDVTNVGDVVLDPCMGTGSTIVAANRVNRVGVGVEIDPIYFEVAVRRLQAVADRPMIHEETGLTLESLIDQRAASSAAAA